MKSIDYVEKKTDGQAHTWLTELAKNILFSQLSKADVGCLVVEEDGEFYTFGDAGQEHSPGAAHIHVQHPSTYTQILFGGATGSGEAYMAGSWSSNNLVQVIKFFLTNKESLDNMNSRWSWINRPLGRVFELFKMNTLAGSKKNIAAHYDLSNDFFQLFLDETMMYSCAMYTKAEDSLKEASCRKLDHICRRLDLSDRDHLLEIGTGWGGMAIYAAKHYGCRVTTTTISNEQYQFAKARVVSEGLEDKVTVLKKDYRELDGVYDKLVSIEMIEAVGHQFYHQFFDRCSRLLSDNGLMLIQAITTSDQRYKKEKNRIDFIRKYIFPGGCLPSNEAILFHSSKYTNMHLVGLEDITFDYARTLADWRSRFFEKINSVKQLGFPDEFIRMWDFYLAYCEGGFSEREVHTSQLLFAKPKSRALPKIADL